MRKKSISWLKKTGGAVFSSSGYVALLGISIGMVVAPVTPDAAQTLAVARIVFVDEQLPLTLKRTGDEFKSEPIPIRNTGDTPGDASFCIHKPEEQKLNCISALKINSPQVTDRPDQIRLDAGQVVQVSIQVPAKDLSAAGYYIALLTHGSSNQPVTTSFRQIKGPAPPFPYAALVTFGIGLLGALVLCVIAGYRLNQAGIKCDARMESGTWEFSKSWASNIAIGGAVITAILGLTILPDSMHHMSKGFYGILSTCLALLSGIAPFFFILFRRVKKNSKDEDELMGNVRAFLVASGIAIWAAISQMLTVGLLLDELSRAGLMPPTLIFIFQVLTLALIGGVVVFCCRTLYWTARSQVQAVEKWEKEIKARNDAIKKAQTPLTLGDDEHNLVYRGSKIEMPPLPLPPSNWAYL